MADLNNLNGKEKELALKILNDLKKGDTNSYLELYYKDYREIPVDIETFITDDRYLGKAWKESSGKLKMFPFWMETLKKLFPTPFTTAFDTVLESGARGLGKSEIACGAICTYMMYRVLCLKDPISYFHLKPTDKIYFAFMNITKQLVEGIAKDKFQKTVQMSPWFMARGKMSSLGGDPYWIPPEPLAMILGSRDSHVRGLPIFFWFFDEISFIPNQDIEKQKQKASIMIQAAVAGMMTRFVHGGKNPTLLVVASSKRSEQSFMEEYIQTLQQREDWKCLTIDKAVWEVKPEGTFKKETFYIWVGNKFLESIVVPKKDKEKLYQLKSKGYSRIIEVPMDFYSPAKEDTEAMLCDYAGISSSSANKYFSKDAVNACIDNNYKNPFPDIIECGNGAEDTAQYYNYFDMDNVPQELMNKPLYVHLDMSISGDMTGIAGVWIIGKKTTTEGDPGKDLTFRLAFSTSIKAPKGRQISFEKNRNFIRWLKQQGFKIKEVTSDTFQSYDLQQQLKAEGFTCSILSVDRVNNKICVPYQYLHSTVYEGRMNMYLSERLYDEFVEIERSMSTGKVDHPPRGHKDVLDAVCGATFTASKYAEEYAYNYGEDLRDTVELNEQINYNNVSDVINNYFNDSGWLNGWGLGVNNYLDINDSKPEPPKKEKEKEKKKDNNPGFFIL